MAAGQVRRVKQLLPGRPKGSWRAFPRRSPNRCFSGVNRLGAGVAGSIASRVDAAGVVLLTPWDSLPNVAQAQFWFLPARWLVLDQYDTVKNLSDYEGPVAVIVAENDEVIAPRHGRNLFASLFRRKTILGVC